jgi:hypothetical protein
MHRVVVKWVVLSVAIGSIAAAGQEQQWTIAKQQFEVDSNVVNVVERLFDSLHQVSPVANSLAKAGPSSQQRAKRMVVVDTLAGYRSVYLSVGTTKMRYDLESGSVRSFRDDSSLLRRPDPSRGYLNSSGTIMPKYRHVTEVHARDAARAFLVALAGSSLVSELELSKSKHVADGYYFKFRPRPAVTGDFFDGRYASLIVCPVSGKVVSYDGRLHPWAKPDYEPTIDSERANTVLQRLIQDSSLTVTGILGGKLHKIEVDGSHRWVWQFHVGEPNQRMNRTVWIDAETGEILRTL